MLIDLLQMGAHENLKARTHWADFPLADCNSRPIPEGSKYVDIGAKKVYY